MGNNCYFDPETGTFHMSGTVTSSNSSWDYVTVVPDGGTSKDITELERLFNLGGPDEQD